MLGGVRAIEQRMTHVYIGKTNLRRHAKLKEPWAHQLLLDITISLMHMEV